MRLLSFFFVSRDINCGETPTPFLSFTPLQKYYSVHLKSSKGSSFSIHAAVYQFPCFTFLKKGRY